jgi:acetyl esterase/lipase
VRTVGATVVGAFLLLAACGTSATDSQSSSSTPAPDLGATAGLAITRDVAIADVTTADVFAPDGAVDVPVVVMFHGTEGVRSNMDPLAADVARSGAVVIVPSWPVITERPPAESTEDIFFEQTAAAVCAVRFADATATEFGGDPTAITVVGHSGGAPLGARVALVEEPPWPGIDCYPESRPQVERFVGTGGDYDNEYQAGTWIPDVYRPYDVFELDVTNHDLEVRLVHGGADSTVDVGKSTVFDQHLDAIGIDSDVVYVDTTHAALRDPSTPGGRLVADQIDALVHGRASIFDAAGPGPTVSFDGDRCDFDGPTTTTLGRPLRIRIIAASEVPVWFALVGFGPGFTDAELTAVLTDEPRLLDETIDYRQPASFVLVPPGSEGEMTWVFTKDSLRWTSWCMPEAGSPHPGAGMMYPASEVVLTP